MKKLMTLMGVTAFALGAFAGTYENKVGFETYALNSGVSSVEGKETYVNSKGTTVEEATLWYCADGDGDSKVEEYGDAAKYDYGSSEKLVDNGPGSQYLSVSTSGNNPLYRTLAHVPNGGEPTQQELDGDIVADTLVQFTASPTAQTPETGAKFALWLLGEDPAEVTGRDPVTNLVVTAGSYDGTTVTPANYNLDVANVSPDQWYRVTVRAVNGIGTMQNSKVGMGFVVYINGTVVTCADSDYADTFGTVDAELSPEAIILKDRKQLFPSMVLDNERTLAGVGFQGTGKVDDLSIVDGTAAPSFVAATTGFVITWSEGVEWFEVDGYSDPFNTDGKDYVIVEPVNGTVTITDVGYAPSYSKGTWPEPDGATLSGETFTLSGSAASGKIVAKTSVFEIGDEPYQTFGAALAAAAKVGGAVTIKAVADFDVTNGDLDENKPFYEISGDITLDLAGRTIKDARYDTASTPLFYVVEGGQMTVIDSAGSGCVVANDDGETGLFYGDYGATVTIGAATGDEGVTVDGTIGSAALVRGFFNDTGAKDLVADGSTISADHDEAGFYTVAPGSTPPEPTTTYKVTFVDYDGTEIASGDVEEGVTPTAPAEDPTRTGYTFKGWYPTIEAVTSNTTYTATYSANTYTVKFYTNSVEYATATYTYGDAATYTAPADPEVDGFKFGGWFTDDGTFEAAFSFSAEVAGNTQVAYAKLTESGSYPSYIPTEDDAVKAKYDAWAKYAGVETASAGELLEEAYLLNCKPDEVAAAKAAFKFTSIYKDGDTWVTPTTTSYNNRDYNGTVSVERYSDVGCTTKSPTGTFFRATLQ